MLLVVLLVAGAVGAAIDQFDYRCKEDGSDCSPGETFPQSGVLIVQIPGMSYHRSEGKDRPSKDDYPTSGRDGPGGYVYVPDNRPVAFGSDDQRPGLTILRGPETEDGRPYAAGSANTDDAKEASSSYGKEASKGESGSQPANPIREIANTLLRETIRVPLALQSDVQRLGLQLLKFTGQGVKSLLDEAKRILQLVRKFIQQGTKAILFSLQDTLVRLISLLKGPSPQQQYSKYH